MEECRKDNSISQMTTSQLKDILKGYGVDGTSMKKLCDKAKLIDLIFQYESLTTPSNLNGLFYAKTRHANKLKALFELLFNNLKTACFTIDKSGIHLKTKTTLNILLEVNLQASLFDEYTIDPDASIHIGVGSYINKSFKTMKSKNTVSLSITNPGMLNISVVSTGKDNFSYNLEVATEDVQTVSIVPYNSYTSKCIRIPSTRFGDVCKLIKSVQDFSVSKEKGQVKISCGTQDILTESFIFGEENPKDHQLIYKVYRTDQLSRISKIVSFTQESAKYVDIYLEDGKEMMVQVVSEIGSIKVYFLEE